MDYGTYQKVYDERYHPSWNEDDLDYLEIYGFFPDPMRYGIADDLNDPTKAIPIRLQNIIQFGALAYEHFWNEKKSLKTRTRLRYLGNEDNFLGYYDYRLYQWDQSIWWKTGNYTLEWRVGAGRKEYPWQGMVNDSGSDFRTIENAHFSVSVDYAISRNLIMQAKYRWEDNRSKKIEDEISTSKATFGLEMRF